MSEQEVMSFSDHPLREVVIRMRQWDEQAKKPDAYGEEAAVSEALGEIESRLLKYLHKK